MDKNKKKKSIGSYLMLPLIVFVLIVVSMLYNDNTRVNSSYNDKALLGDVQCGNVAMVSIQQNKEVPTGTVLVVFTNGEKIRYFTPDLKDTLVIAESDEGVEVFVSDMKRESTAEKFGPYIFGIALAIMIFLILAAQANAANGGSKMSNFGKSRAKKDVKTGITFKEVAGLEEEKEELNEIVDFLKSPEKYTRIGARIPKGVILTGPPGTGKTLLAKAVSGEAGVPFFSISGSDFVEMFVGVGASRVRDLFADAKANAPCVIFIDEIDAVARRRGSGLGGGHDEREQTLNQLLVEMDGFGVNEGIIVMAATNRVDILDPAILRPGRFDRKVEVGRPDVKGREEILRVHVKNKPLGDDVDLHEIARTTSGFAGADLENLMNEAAIQAAKEDRGYIIKKDVDRAFIKIGIGTEKKSRIVPERDRRITAYHEAGHAILFHELDLMDPVHTVSIIPTGNGAAGYTMPLPGNDNEHVTKKQMLQHIQVCLGGRIAEQLTFDDITTGASQDIRQATALARDMVTKYGFSEKIGPINYETNDNDEVFLGREIGREKIIGSQTAADIDSEVHRIIEECYAEATKVIEAYKDVLERAAEMLLEKDKITGAEFDALFPERFAPKSDLFQ